MKLGPYDLDQIYTGDARELAKAIPNESVDLIFTDPVYQNIDDYRWLAETAARVLKPNSAVLVWCGIGYLPEIHDALRAGGLSYRWRLIVRPVNSKEFNGRLLITTQECLWYEKGCSYPRQSIFDCDLSTTKGHYNVSGSNWGKGLDICCRYIETFSDDGAAILDPFCGLGAHLSVCKMLGRHYLAFEIDPKVAEDARWRVKQTQPPLLIPEPEQVEMFAEVKA